MRTVKLNNKEVKIYDSIDEMPIQNFQKYNKYLLIDSGIGSDCDSIDAHIRKVAKFIHANDKEQAIAELTNMRQNMFMITSEISPHNMAFAALIHSIDGRTIDDYSDENMRSILDSLNTVKQSFLHDLLMQIKKKINSELEIYFPSMFESAKEKEAYSKLKRRTELVLEGIAEDKDNAEILRGIDLFFLNLHKPKPFVGKRSVEVTYDKQYESMCLVISQNANANPRTMTVLQFYNALQLIEQQIKAKNKLYSK